METILYVIFFVFFLFGTIGAYAMAIGIMNMVAKKEGRLFYFAFIYPGMIYIIGYSILGFLSVLQPWNYFSEDSPVLWVIKEWKENKIGSAISSILFIGTAPL